MYNVITITVQVVGCGLHFENVFLSLLSAASSGTLYFQCNAMFPFLKISMNHWT